MSEDKNKSISFEAHSLIMHPSVLRRKSEAHGNAHRHQAHPNVGKT